MCIQSVQYLWALALPGGVCEETQGQIARLATTYAMVAPRADPRAERERETESPVVRRERSQRLSKNAHGHATSHFHRDAGRVRGAHKRLGGNL